MVHALVAQPHEVSNVDPLTGALNRRGLEERALAVRSQSARAGAVTCVAIIDMDEFKEFNDAHGHVAGDARCWPASSATSRLPASARPRGALRRRRVRRGAPVHRRARRGPRGARAADTSNHPWTWGIARRVEGETLWEAIERADNALYEAATRAPRAVDEARPARPRPLEGSVPGPRDAGVRAHHRSGGELTATASGRAPLAADDESTTPATTIAPPTSTSAVSCSCSTTNPSATATTGLT